MVKRRKLPTKDDKGYVVGYGKPPVHSRFQPGQSGNPAGRCKGVPNIATDVKRTLLKPVHLKQEGRTQKRTTQESLLLVLRQKALRGDGRALDRLLELALRFNNDLYEAAAAQPMPADDQAILAAYVAESTDAQTKRRPAPGGQAGPRRPRRLLKRLEQ